MNIGVGNVPKPAYHGSGQETVSKQETPDVKAAVYHEFDVEAVGNDKAENIPEVVSVEQNVQSETAAARREIGLHAESRENKRNDSVKRAVEEINKKAKNSEAIFGIHEDTNRITIKIIDKDSKEVLREYPPEETLDMIAKVWELAGIMIDERG